ncbi:MAG: cyclic nucleotide-binding domain-containing protein [Candidatus Marinimicrobia bacterium]|jgi:CRP-like cAMP-binding protein|nr:cyclic nucleotide-binding domain-containing protein [Candidatus Neomarinimicrobiota bacterium]MBT3617945.1 cyclic nucleotide-binding domain-containing protein [Candidatus Neomarinimicrobiota bacterium]MBT3828684.1 cyclic nucleotide-binding domain-containing protein [Candidatus Neomarinimicrobiota bacterium]MBT3998194.1 cyclic nucleotide-binding domain-containing protein [Candidatus Neomarinimicrobiota bacterium]MBT4280109.1 cyclic nucleotide-binding domain-containing protein [Candidatus Neom
MKNALWNNIFQGWNSQESETVLTLKQVPIFKGFTDKEFQDLEKLFHRRAYDAGEFVFKNRAPGEGMYIIMKGAVKITIGTRENNEQILAELSEGSFFGELALFDDDPRSANAIATVQSDLLGFFTADLMTLNDRNPQMGNKILLNLGGVLGERLRGTNQLLLESQSN